MDMFTVAEASQLIRAGELSAEELTASCLRTIECDNPHTNAFVYVDGEQALVAAKEVDAGVRGRRALMSSGRSLVCRSA